jgi:hypothetical protein
LVASQIGGFLSPASVFLKEGYLINGCQMQQHLSISQKNVSSSSAVKPDMQLCNLVVFLKALMILTVTLVYPGCNWNLVTSAGS